MGSWLTLQANGKPALVCERANDEVHQSVERTIDCYEDSDSTSFTVPSLHDNSTVEQGHPGFSTSKDTYDEENVLVLREAKKGRKPFTVRVFPGAIPESKEKDEQLVAREAAFETVFILDPNSTEIIIETIYQPVQATSDGTTLTASSAQSPKLAASPSSSPTVGSDVEQTAVDTIDSLSTDESSESDSASSSDDSDTDLSFNFDEHTDLEECLYQYRRPANITVDIMSLKTLPGAKQDEEAWLTYMLYNRTKHWGLGHGKPEIELEYIEGESCLTNATNYWNALIAEDKDEGLRLPCVTHMSPKLDCTDESSCRTYCALHLHRHNAVLVGLLSALGGMALATLLGLSLCCCRRYQRKKNARKPNVLAPVIIETTPSNTDGTVELELDNVNEPNQKPSTLSRRIRHHLSSQPGFPPRTGLFSYFSSTNPAPANDGGEKGQGGRRSSSGSKGETLDSYGKETSTFSPSNAL